MGNELPEASIPIIVITERSLAATGLYRALQGAFAARTVFVDDAWPERISAIPDHGSAQAVLWFVHFRLLMAATEDFDWGDYSGHRLLYDQDASQAVMSVGFNPVNERWVPTFRRHGFDLLLCTGKRITESLNSLGVPAFWWPKAYDPEYFMDLGGGQRSGYCHFGSPYVSRQAMLRKLRREGIPVDHIQADYKQLTQSLNRYLALLVCTLSNRTRGRVSRAMRRLNPEWGLRLAPGPEPMLKLFEGAASGCAVFNDYLEELSDLGFVDGETVVTWRDFDELVVKARYYLGEAEQLASIGRKASALCRERHTWEHRADALRSLLLGAA